MAQELGPIQYTNVNQGTRTVDTSAEDRALAQGLNIASQAITEGAKAHVRGELNEALLEGLEFTEVAPAVEELTDEELEAFSTMTPERRAEFTALTMDLRRAQVKAQQADREATRGLALLSMKNKQAELRVKFGFMADDVDRTAVNLAAHSPELLAAELAARGSASQRKASSDFVERIWDDAKRLGVPAHYAPGTPEFAREYEQRSNWEAERSRKQLRYDYLKATEQLSNKERLRRTTEVLNDIASPIYAEVEQPIVDGLKGIWDLQRIGASEGEIAGAFQEFQERAPVFRTKIAKAKAALQEKFNEQWNGQDVEGAEYKSAQASLQNELQSFAVLEEMIDQGNLKIVDYLNAKRAIRVERLLEDAPTMALLADLNSVGENFLADIARYDKTWESQPLQQALSRGLGAELEGAMGRYSLDRQKTRGITDPREREQERNSLDSRSAFSGGLSDSNDPVDKAQEQFTTFDQQHRAITNQPLEYWKGNPAATEGAFFMMAGTLQRSHRDIPRAGKDASEQIAQMESLYASDQIWDMIDVLGNNNADVADFAYQIQTSWLDGKGPVQGLKPADTTRQEIRNTARSQRLGSPFIEFFEVNTDKLEEEGRISFTLNEEKARAAIIRHSELLTKTSGMSESAAASVKPFLDVDRELKRLRREGDALALQLSNYLRIRALADYGRPEFPMFSAGLINAKKGDPLLSVLALSDANPLQ